MFKICTAFYSSDGMTRHDDILLSKILATRPPKVGNSAIRAYFGPTLLAAANLRDLRTMTANLRDSMDSHDGQSTVTL